jgi:hypothetical protein
MANLRAIRMRIKSVESTRQITKSMKMVAAAKLRKTQLAFGRLRDFADKSGEILRAMSAGTEESPNPYLHPHEKNERVCYLLIVGNRGLCGTYNHSLLRFLEELRAEEKRESLLYVAGRWGRDLIGQADRRFEISDTPSAQEARELTEALKKLYREGVMLMGVGYRQPAEAGVEKEKQDIWIKYLNDAARIHVGYTVVLLVSDYMNADGSLTPFGKLLEEQFVSVNPNVRLVVCGNGQGTARADKDYGGYKVTTVQLGGGAEGMTNLVFNLTDHSVNVNSVPSGGESFTIDNAF